MQIVIDIPKEDYIKISNSNPNYADDFNLYYAIKNGTVLPEKHGRLIDADALIDTLGCSDRDIYVKACIEEDAPTIII